MNIFTSLNTICKKLSQKARLFFLGPRSTSTMINIILFSIIMFTKWFKFKVFDLGSEVPSFKNTKIQNQEIKIFLLRHFLKHKRKYYFLLTRLDPPFYLLEISLSASLLIIFLKVKGILEFRKNTAQTKIFSLLLADIVDLTQDVISVDLFYSKKN